MNRAYYFLLETLFLLFSITCAAVSLKGGLYDNVPVTKITVQLPQSKKNGLSYLEQSMVNKENVIYKVEHAYNLGGKTIKLKNNVTLDFDGGCFYNGQIVFNNTHLAGSFSSILCKCYGTFVGVPEVDYFGVTPSNTAENNSANIKNIEIEKFCYKFGAGIYRFSSPIEIRKDCEYSGLSRRLTTLLFDNSDGFIVTPSINTIADYVSSRVDFRDLCIESSGNCFDLYSAKQKDDSSISKGLSYSTFENLLLISRNGNGFYSTTPTRTTYANMYRNILFTVPNGACFCNSYIYLCSRIENCADLSSKYFFYNCFLRQTYVENCNFGFGYTSNHIFYNDKKGIIDDQTAKFICCNFEEQKSNPFVNLRENTICSFQFENCNFNLASEVKGVVGNEVYIVKDGTGFNIEKVKYDKNKHKGRYSPCVGYGLYFSFDETCDFSWFNSADHKKFPFLVNTYCGNKNYLRRLSCPDSQKYRVYIKGIGERYIKGYSVMAVVE